MFGYEFSPLVTHHKFPEYDSNQAVEADKITRILPLLWQEHCVECGMPECYKTCRNYQKRADGRCKLFKYGIEPSKNPNAVLGYNAVIETRKWAKLQTFFFTNSVSYKQAVRINKFFCLWAKAARLLKNGKIRRFCYYINEYFSRKIGFKELKDTDKLPEYLLFELINNDEPYTLSFESNAGAENRFRTAFSVERGYNRFLIPTEKLNYTDVKKSGLCIYSNEERDIVMNIISLCIVDFDKEYKKTLFSSENKKVKVVIWDLDNTLWDGILSEDGIDGIKLRTEVVEIIKSLDAKGIINSVASKNNADSAMEALKHFQIDEYFVAPMINWQPKSQNIKAISKALDLNIDTFVFVDDTPNELSEVLNNCSGIRVCDVRNISDFVCRESFNVPVTSESKNRRKMYIELSKRNSDLLNYKNDMDSFLRDCKMTMHIRTPEGDEYERCYELLQRTNQLNISAERLSESELISILNSTDYECYRIKVDDKYGDYGLVGFAVFDTRNTEAVVLKHFVFSCRAARKKLEQSFFEEIMDVYSKKGYKKLVLTCKRTERNALMQSVLIESGLFEKTSENQNSFELSVNLLPDNFKKSNIAAIVTD